MRKTFKKILTKLVMGLSLILSIFSFCVIAQTEKAMDANALTALVKDLKEVVAKNAPDEKDTKLVAEKWDTGRDLTGKTRKEVIDLLWGDVKSVIKDSGVRYQIYSIFSFYRQIPDETASAQTKSFLAMTEPEKAEYVSAKIDELTTKISGKKYPFDSNFKAQVSIFVEGYAKRVNKKDKNRPIQQDLTLVMQRGTEYAPTINTAFDKQGVSRLLGLYLAMIESEFNNNSVSMTGSSGAFHLTTPQAKKFGMTSKDKAVLSKSSEIAARLLVEYQNYFAAYKMKEYLALLGWNRPLKKINFDLNFKFMSDSENIACPICGLTGSPTRFDQQFQVEAVRYIPMFLAAAIVGENPTDFGLNTKPLSTL
jgi:hypothetical protein